MKATNFFLAITAVFFASTSFAGKVVVFDGQAAILGSNSSRAQIEEFEKNPEVVALVNAAKELQQELKESDDDAKKNSLTWGEEKKKEHAKSQESTYRKLQELSAKIQEAQKALFGRLLKDGEPKVSPILEGIVKADDISIVLRKEAVFVALPDSDITPKVIAALNKMDEAISGK